MITVVDLIDKSLETMTYRQLAISINGNAGNINQVKNIKRKMSLKNVLALAELHGHDEVTALKMYQAQFNI